MKPFPRGLCTHIVRMSARIYIYIYMYTYIHTYVHTYIYICVYYVGTFILSCLSTLPLVFGLLAWGKEQGTLRVTVLTPEYNW